MKIFLVGQKWLAYSVFKRISPETIVGVSTPSETDKLYQSALSHNLDVNVHGKKLLACDIPEGVDLIVCAHAYCIVSPEAISKAAFGAIGYHPSLLPLHRGRDAVRWSIHMRERITGGTVYWLDDGIDTGDIELQDWVFIEPSDTARSLWERELGPMGVRLLVESIDNISSGLSSRTPQNNDLATLEPAFP